MMIMIMMMQLYQTDINLKTNLFNKSFPPQYSFEPALPSRSRDRTGLIMPLGLFAFFFNFSVCPMWQTDYTSPFYCTLDTQYCTVSYIVILSYSHLAIQPPPHSNSWPVTLQSSWHSHSTSGATSSGCIGSIMPAYINCSYWIYHT